MCLLCSKIGVFCSDDIAAFSKFIKCMKICGLPSAEFKQTSKKLYILEKYAINEQMNDKTDDIKYEKFS